MTARRTARELDLEHPPAAVPALRDHDEALAWFTAEAANLAAACRMAADRGRLASCWQLAYSLRGFFFLTRRLDDWVRTHRLALAATCDLRNQHAEVAADWPLPFESYEAFDDILRGVLDPMGL